MVKLKAFEKEPWPPTNKDGTTASTATTSSSAIERKAPSSLEANLQALNDDASVVTAEIDDDNITIATAVDASAEEDAQRANTTWDNTVGEGEKLSAKENAMLQRTTENDDVKNSVEEPMHESIEYVLGVYSTILRHPSRTSKVCELAMECVQLLVANDYVSGRAGGRDDPTGSGSKAIAQSEKESGSRKDVQPPSLLHRIMEAVASCSNYNSDTVQTAACKTFRALITCKKCGVHEGSLLLALRSAFHVYLVGKTPITKDVAKACLIDMLRSVFGRLEAQEARLQSAGNKQNNQQGSGSNSNNVAIVTPLNSQYHTDGYVLFRALCKLSSKELPGDGEADNRASLFSSPPDPMALNNKVLSLELILAVMQFSGNAFCQGEKFIYLIQNYLCVGLLKNCTSNQTNVAFLSQKIFLLLVRYICSSSCVRSLFSKMLTSFRFLFLHFFHF